MIYFLLGAAATVSVVAALVVYVFTYELGVATGQKPAPEDPASSTKRQSPTPSPVSQNESEVAA